MAAEEKPSIPNARRCFIKLGWIDIYDWLEKPVRFKFKDAKKFSFLRFAAERWRDWSSRKPASIP